MRAGFLAALLAGASLYTWLAFVELSWLSTAGRLGPGFFPRIIGVALLVLCAHGLFKELQAPREPLSPFWRTTLLIAAMSAAFVALFEVLGGLLAMVAFMAGALALLNRGRPLQNAALAIVLPVCLYLVFKVWLNAALPRGLLPL